MSIIRLSLLGDGLYAPDHKGVITETRQFHHARGRDRRGLGPLGAYACPALPEPGDPLTRYLGRSLAVEAARLPPDAPLVVMIHGFQFDPATAHFSPPHHHKADNPHARVFHFEHHPPEIEMRHHSTSWPRGLGIAPDDAGASGLALAFGWYSNPGFFSSLFRHGKNFYARAYEMAETAAWQLACVLDALARSQPGREIDLFCHSLGSRVVIRALALLAERDTAGPALSALGRVLILAGAEKVMEAQLMMARLNRARARGALSRLPEFWNLLSRENDVLDKLGENFGPASAGSKQVIGHNGLEARDPAWLDLQLDDGEVAAWCLARGHRVSGDNQSSVFAVLDHWIHYTWPGNMGLYRDILRARETWRIATLRAEHPEIFDQLRLNRLAPGTPSPHVALSPPSAARQA